MKRKYAKLTLEQLGQLLDAADIACAAIQYARRNGGKYRSVERMFTKISEYEQLRKALGL
jgi:hypothetical protein